MTDTWLATHLPRLARLLFALQLAAFAFFVAGTPGAFTRMPDPPTTTDFASFYTAGRLADLGRAPDAYDPAAHARAEAAVIAPGVEEKRFLNPPVFLLVCAPLARLPYLPAFILFELATFLPWLWLTTRIAGGGRLAALCLASIPAVMQVFKIKVDATPTIDRIVALCNTHEAFAKADPYRQPGAPPR